MMKILIVEDEIHASKKLEILIKKFLPDCEIIGPAKSVDEAVNLIEKNIIDIGFFDIQIEDGLSFDIFEKCNVKFPVIFTTAFNQYAVRAFKLNSIDYLLKPIAENELKNALEKYKQHWRKQEKVLDVSVIDEVKKLIKGEYKERFTIKTGAKIRIINTQDVCYFYSENKATYAKYVNNKDYLLDYSLDSILPLLNPDIFFRISRKYIVNINHIKDIYAYSNSRLKINTVLDNNDELIVSREKVKIFKDWIG